MTLLFIKLNQTRQDAYTVAKWHGKPIRSSTPDITGLAAFLITL
jgi:hypothetical protein